MTDQPPDTLEPQLTKFDQRVLAALDWWTVGETKLRELRWRNAWQVAEALREYDVKQIRETLDGLVHVGRAMHSRHWDHRRTWVAIPKRPNDDAPLLPEGHA